MTTSTSTQVFDPESLRCWLADHEMRISTFGAAIGQDRVTVHRWLTGFRMPEIPIPLLLVGLDLGARGRNWEAPRLRRWMTREAYDTSTLARDLGMHRTTVGRWLGDVKPQHPVPFWLSIATAALEGDVAARRERRRAQRQVVARAS